MDLTNESYVIFISTKSSTEHYYRDKNGWLKVSTRGRKFRATAEQVLNHVLPALAGIKPHVTIKVEHPGSGLRESTLEPSSVEEALSQRAHRRGSSSRGRAVQRQRGEHDRSRAADRGVGSGLRGGR
jgi:hypothetical protein